MKITAPQRALLTYLNANERNRVVKIRHNLFVDHEGFSLPAHTIRKLLDLNLMAQHPYRLDYWITEDGKKYLQNLKT